MSRDFAEERLVRIENKLDQIAKKQELVELKLEAQHLITSAVIEDLAEHIKKG